MCAIGRGLMGRPQLLLALCESAHVRAAYLGDE
jgi:hypothetical protein